MSSVVDFLEKMGSEAQWRNASQDEIAGALAEAEIEAPMCMAILTGNATEVQTILGQTKLIGEYIPSPSPEPDKEDEDEEDDENTEQKQAIP